MLFRSKYALPGRLFVVGSSVVDLSIPGMTAAAIVKVPIIEGLLLASSPEVGWDSDVRNGDPTRAFLRAFTPAAIFGGSMGALRVFIFDKHLLSRSEMVV